MRRLPPLTVLALCLALPLGGCGRELEEGRYDFVAVRVEQDTCATGARFTAPADIEDGSIEVHGESVQVEVERHGALEELGRALTGRFLENPEREEFIADATFDVYAEMGPGAPRCLAFLHIHLHGVVDSPEKFHGELRFDYTRRPSAEPECLPACVLDLEIEATRY